MRNSQFNDNWKFKIDDNIDGSSLDIDDSLWRSLSLPHDWSIEKPYDNIKGDGATAYLTGGIGWYRKVFSIDPSFDGRIYIHFDGIYNNSTLWINGSYMGEHPYGYSPFFFDITDYLNRDESENLIAIKVDRSRYVDSRWYSGSGIYRDVELIVTNKLHFPVWSCFINSYLENEGSAKVEVNLDILNKYFHGKEFILELSIYHDDILITDTKAEYSISKDTRITTKHVLHIINPKLWDINSPNLYKLKYSIVVDNNIIDCNETRFGIRNINYCLDYGFFLNHRKIKIQGLCLHHDAGLVGASVPRDVWRRRLLKLKAAGCNAIRVSHNPSSTVLLELCDELGLLVQDEFFDEWDYPKDKRLNMKDKHDDYLSRGYSDYFGEWAELDLKNTILSHRNHPSIIQWSIGNEIEWTYPGIMESTGYFDINADGNYFWNKPPNSKETIKKKLHEFSKTKVNIATTAMKLSNWVKDLDITRPVIANCILPSVSFESGYTDALDIVGFSYRRIMYDYSREKYPEKLVMGTENVCQWHDWKAVIDRSYISGTFLWTGIDYLGEVHSDKWPKKGMSSGLLDFAGFKKPSFFMFKSLWSKDITLKIYTQNFCDSPFKVNEDGSITDKIPDSWKHLLWEWRNVNDYWDYNVNENIIVEAYSNCSSVELFLNNQSLGEKKLEDFPDRIYKWIVPFRSGEVKAIGQYFNQKITDSLCTPDRLKGINIEIDKKEIKANNRDCVHIDIRLVDAGMNPVKTDERELQFTITGECRNLGVDNGSAYNTQNHKATKIRTHNGRALMILQATYECSRVTVEVSSSDLESREVTFYIK